MREYTVETEDGDRLKVREDGDTAGIPVFGLHGTPGSRVMPRRFTSDARRKGICLLSYDRPGYGESTPVPGRRIDHTAREVVALADHLGIDRFGVWGFSGGGAPALACAAGLPKRVIGAASLSGLAPFGAEGLDWFAGMGEMNVSDFQLMLHDRPAWERKSRADREELLAATGESLRAMWASLLSPVDLAGFSAEAVQFLVDNVKEGLKNGDEGMRDDSLSQAQPWGIDLGSVRVPVQVWHGREDRFVPFAHGQWLAAHIPGAVPHLLTQEGHLTLVFDHIQDVHAWIRTMA